MASVLAILEEREKTARREVEALRENLERLRDRLSRAEADLDRKVVAREELVEAFAVKDGTPEPVKVAPARVPAVVKKPVSGAVVPVWRENLSADQALSPGYQRLLAVVESCRVQDVLRAGELASRLGAEPSPSGVEGVRVKAKRLAERGWLVQDGPGFRRRPVRD